MLTTFLSIAGALFIAITLGILVASFVVGMRMQELLRTAVEAQRGFATNLSQLIRELHYVPEHLQLEFFKAAVVGVQLQMTAESADAILYAGPDPKMSIAEGLKWKFDISKEQSRMDAKVEAILAEARKYAFEKQVADIIPEDTPVRDLN